MDPPAYAGGTDLNTRFVTGPESFPVFGGNKEGSDHLDVLEVASELIKFRQPEVMN